jgi:sarcosine oxidase, subunit delta
MLRFNCPRCGLRDESEFRFLGEARTRPMNASSTEWAHYLFWRRNPVGPHIERWVHSSGCRQWLQVERDTRTNIIISVREESAAPGLEAPESAP